MDTLADMIDRRAPVAADSRCDDVLSRFIREPDAHVLAVVEAGAPVGLVPREPFMTRMEAPQAGDRPIRELMAPAPVIAAADARAAGFVARMLAEQPTALANGFVVVDADGGYLGVGTALTLLAARSAPNGDGGSLAQRIAAEVREPVHAMLAAGEQLRRLSLPAAATAGIDAIAEQGAAALALVETAADLDAAERGAFTLAPQRRRLQDLMDDVEARWRGRAENAGVTLLVAYDGDPDCAALVDSPRMLQVFDALIGHALAHVRHGVIEASLKTRGREDGVSVSGAVRDNGALHDPADLEALFDAAGGDARVGLAVRLGLALAARTVQAMGGRLTAEPNIGDGATITFEAVLGAGEALAADHAPALTAAARSAHILVVDDNATNRMVVEALCEMFDCSTESVVDGVEAVEAARHGRFDVILMDIRMPRMDGVTATREIRKLKGPCGRTPIIALTANADPDDVAQYMQAGMIAVVEKPIKPERLMEALDAVLSGEAPPAAKGAAAA